MQAVEAEGARGLLTSQYRLEAQCEHSQHNRWPPRRPGHWGQGRRGAVLVTYQQEGKGDCQLIFYDMSGLSRGAG